MQIHVKKIASWLITGSFTLLVACSVYSCKHSQNGEYSATLDYDTASLNQYRTYLKNLDTTHAASNTTAAQKYAEIFKSANQETRDSAFSVYKDFYNKLDQILDNNHDLTISYDSLIIDSGVKAGQLSPKLKAYAKNLKDNGFMVYMSEGDPYIGQDLDFEAKWFYYYLSNPLKAFLKQLNKEEKEGFTEDAGLTINPEQFVDRTIWWENFSKKYAQTIVGKASLENWKSYLGIMMNGMDNSPIMDAEHPLTLNPYYQSAYSLIVNKYGSTETARLISPYFKALMAKDTAKAKKVMEGYKSQKLIF